MHWLATWAVTRLESQPARAGHWLVWWLYRYCTLRHFGVETYILGMIAFHNRMIISQPLRVIGFQIGDG